MEASQISQTGGQVSSPTFGMRASVGEPFGTEPTTAPAAGTTAPAAGQTAAPQSPLASKLSSGFLAIAFAQRKQTPAQLDLTVLYAREAPLGLEIQPATWQRDKDPIFLWEPPSTGLDLAGYSYAIDGDPDDVVDTTKTSFDVATELPAPLADGIHTFTVKALNTAGNAGKPISFELWVDTIPPTVTTYAPTPGSLLRTTTPSITATLSDAHSGVSEGLSTLLINGSSVPILFDPLTQTMTTTGTGTFKQGANSLELRVSDTVGNKQVPLLWSVTVDTVPPSGTVVINAGAKTTTGIYVTLTLSASDATSGVAAMQLSNDQTAGYVQEAFGATRELWALHAIQGVQRVWAKFVDAAGNVSEAVSDDIELILLSPDTVITSGPAGFTSAVDATFTFMCQESGCLFSYAFDNEEWSEWSASTKVTRTGFSAGNHYFRVKAARDTNGVEGVQPEEEDPSPAERTWIVMVETTPTLPGPLGPPIKLWRID